VDECYSSLLGNSQRANKLAGSDHVTCVSVWSAQRKSRTVFSVWSAPRLYNKIPRITEAVESQLPVRHSHGKYSVEEELEVSF
jgi:hypothetical protein